VGNIENLVTLNMIVGPFEEPFLEASLKSIAPLCSKMIIVDTAPGDNPNRAVMERSGAHIIDLPRKEQFNFSEARNTALDASKTEWIMKFDADEVMHVKYLSKLYKLYRETDCNAIEVTFWHHFLEPGLYRPINDDKKCILIRREHLIWSRPVHEGSHITGEILKSHDIKFNHYGYVKPQREIWKRWKLYSSLGGGPDNVDELDPDHMLDYIYPSLKPYQDEHPPVAISIINQLFPDLET
jgi:glycosyltransferase involved in cell wall biosynthesis